MLHETVVNAADRPSWPLLLFVPLIGSFLGFTVPHWFRSASNPTASFDEASLMSSRIAIVAAPAARGIVADDPHPGTPQLDGIRRDHPLP
jgi:hypothetical protein